MGITRMARQLRALGALVGMGLLLSAALVLPGCQTYDVTIPCESDADCYSEQACDLGRGFCRPLSCVRACEVRECGDDGCGLSCGTCPAGESCSQSGQCLGTCSPDCLGRECGDDGCGGSCGNCNSPETCYPDGICSAETPCCGGRECGPDPCAGTSCGTCTGAGEICVLAIGRCQPCEPNCTGRECGDDGCGGSCGTCAAGETCYPDGICSAETPCCGMRECGPDPCTGTSCGTCGMNLWCDAGGRCQGACTPDCTGLECGDDGCGGSCGTCGMDEVCEAGACRSSLRLMGEACQGSGECETGWCLRYADGTGYCSVRDCAGPDDCVNHAAGETALMCCVDVGGDFSVCLKIEPGYTCGIQDKTCGQSCAGQLDSACDPNNACLPGQERYCSHYCVTNADCNDCQSGDPGVFFQCQVIEGGDSYCVALGTNSCTSSSQCAAGEVCAPYLDPYGNSLQGYCGARGALPSGAECSEDDDQCMGMCLNTHCSEVCESDGDCPEQNTCTSVSLCKTMAGTGECAVCTESFPAIRMCLWYPVGSQPAGAACAFGAINTGAGDCLPGMTCLGVDAVEEPCATVGDCDPIFQENWNSECVTGTCGNPNHCGASFCSPRCALDGSCEEGFQPALVGSDCYCIPAPPEGGGLPGDPCPFELTNTDADNCMASLVCLGTLVDQTTLACVTADDCLADYQASWNPDCVQINGQGHCGVSFCSGQCDVDGSCATGFLPVDVNGACYCIPDDQAADGQPGEPCDYDTVNMGSGACSAGLICLGVAPDPLNAPCATVADCAGYFDVLWNPDCVGGGCGVSFCAGECAGGLCDAGFVPIDVNGSCYCVPDTSNATGQPGDPCPFGPANEGAPECSVGLSCLGIMPDATNYPCPAGDEDCLNFFGAYWNLDCVGGGCGVSFCSPACNAGACDVGFDPYDISGACYCVPNQ